MVLDGGFLFSSHIADQFISVFLQCFHDPYTGSRFCSKKEVLQHLKSGKFRGSPTKQTRSITTRSMEKLCASANLEEENKTNFAKNVCSQQTLLN